MDLDLFGFRFAWYVICPGAICPDFGLSGCELLMIMYVYKSMLIICNNQKEIIEKSWFANFLNISTIILNISPIILNISSVILNISPTILNISSTILNISPIILNISSVILNISSIILN